MGPDSFFKGEKRIELVLDSCLEKSAGKRILQIKETFQGFPRIWILNLVSSLWAQTFAANDSLSFSDIKEHFIRKKYCW
jgi:hypothetical protein